MRALSPTAECTPTKQRLPMSIVPNTSMPSSTR
jgi:hypothetical protein